MTFYPELGTVRRGKVRDIYESAKTLTLIASDRVSIFDRILNESIAGKGSLLTRLSLFWFERTKDILQNHLISHPDPSVMVVKKCTPFPIEVIVRGYLAGSLWRDYQSGKREKCGVKIPDGLIQNQALPQPIVTPTTKSDDHDEDITEEEIVARKLASFEEWKQIKNAALQLFQRGQTLLQEKGIILVDTKYEFGLDDAGALCLIDEIHTPDSSRFWFASEAEKKEIRLPDKEFLREWGRSIGFTGSGAVPKVPDEIRLQAWKGYARVFEAMTGEAITPEQETRRLENLKKAGVIKGKFVLQILGSEKDLPHAEKIGQALTEHNIPYSIVVASAHKQPREVVEIIDLYNRSEEPVVCIAIAGRSNALGGLLSANLRWPVISCPPFKDYSDYLANIHSSLQMPSQTPNLTILDPTNAALAASKILQCMELAR